MAFTDVVRRDSGTEAIEAPVVAAWLGVCAMFYNVIREPVSRVGGEWVLGVNAINGLYPTQVSNRRSEEYLNAMPYRRVSKIRMASVDTRDIDLQQA